MLCSQFPARLDERFEGIKQIMWNLGTDVEARERALEIVRRDILNDIAELEKDYIRLKIVN